LSEVVKTELRPLLLKDDNIETVVTDYSIKFVRDQEGYSYKKEFVELRFKAERWDSWPLVGLEFSVYSTSDDLKTDWNKERLVMVGRLAEYFIDKEKKEYFIETCNAIYELYEPRKKAIREEKYGIERAIQALDKQEDQTKKDALLKKVRGKGVFFNATSDKNGRYTKSNFVSCIVRFNDSIQNLASLRIVKEAASGLSATIEYRNWVQVPSDKHDEDGYIIYTWVLSEHLYTYDRVKMDHIIGCINRAEREKLIAQDDKPSYSIEELITE
jgi:hypothetical protein